MFLLHPSQPLSHISRLIAASFTYERLDISFRVLAPNGKPLQWSESTDVADFIRDAARAAQFEIYVKGDAGARSIRVEVPTFVDRTRFLRRRLQRIEREVYDMEQLKRQCDIEAHRGARRMATGGLAMLVVYWGSVARLTFWDLGWYAPRIAPVKKPLSFIIFRDIMEPVTYLSGLSMVILGYLWFVITVFR